jgi:hypothetical protein
MTALPTRDLVDPGVIPVDSWTVYGEVCPDEHEAGSLAVDVPDIGVLPPPGRYRGTVRTGAGPVPAQLVVERAAQDATPRLQRVTVIPLGACGEVRSPLPIVFTGVEAAGP